MKKQKLDPDKWATKIKWAARLEVSTKTIERWIDESVWNYAEMARITINRIVVESDDRLAVVTQSYPVLSESQSPRVSGILAGVRGGAWPE